MNVQTLMRCVLAVALMLPGLRGQVPQDATALRERLAAIELQVTVDRDIAGAEAALSELERACTGTEMEAVLAAPEAQSMRGRIVAAIAAARSPDRVSLPQVVADAIVAQDEITLQTLGHEAAVELRESLVAPMPPLADIHATVRFDWLLRLDEAEAWAFLGSGTATAAFEAENGPWLVRSIQQSGLRWVIRDGRTPSLERPEWLDVIARLLRTGSAPEAFGDRAERTGILVGLLANVAQHDAFSPALIDALSTLLASMDGYAVLTVLQSPAWAGWAPSQQALFERLVADPREAVRRQAAELLVEADVSAGLRSRVHDSSSAVRLSLVKSLGKRQRQVARWAERSDSPRLESQSLEPPADAEAGHLLATLAADPDPAVREAVIHVLASEPAAVDADVYRQLAADSDALVRKALVAVTLADVNLQAEVLSLLASDSVQQVTDAVDERLQRTDETAGTAWFAPVLRARLANGTAPLRWVPQGLLRVPAARAELTNMLLRTGDELLLSVLGDSMLSKDRARHVTTVGDSSLLKDWVTLPGAEMARLFPLLRRISPLLPPALASVASDGNVDASVPPALDALVADTTLPLADRLAACAITLHEPTPERCTRLLALLSDPSLGEGTDFVEQDHTLVAAAIKSVPLERRNAVIRDILQSVALRDDLALEVAGRFEPSAPLATEVVPLVLDRWLEREGSMYFMQSALQVVGRTPELASEDLMRRALRSPAPYGESAVAAMGRLRDPRFLDLLRECLDPTWYRGDGPALAISAISALQGYMNDEAAAILLDAAANSPSSRVRAKALEAVEAIGRYRDALAAWQRRTASASTRDAAVAKLAASVADKKGMEDVRAEAVRALGVLQAVEQLPLIIDALTDNSRLVREAAREALDRINAAVPASAPAKAKPPAEPEPDTEPDQP